MSFRSVAKSIGVRRSVLKSLLNGKVRRSLAQEIGARRSVVQSFIDGDVRRSMAKVMGSKRNAVQELRDEVGREGAIGIVIGLCVEEE